MKKNFYGLSLFALVFGGCSSNNHVIPISSNSSSIDPGTKSSSELPKSESEFLEESSEVNESIHSNSIVLTIGNQTFKGVLYDNETAQEFKKLLPLTITMNELNRNEKFYDLPNSLPTNSKAVKSISTGDLLLFGSNTLVLFYEDYLTSYSYTPLGIIENPVELRSALGKGDVELSIE